jgi:hypothetical protein
VAHKRPTASDVDDNARTEPASRPDTVPEELAEIVLRAGRLGFSRWRVANALGLSAVELERLERLEE